MTEQNIPDAELEVLACLQQQGEASARQIRESMAGYRPMSHGSMVTLLKRLEAKELVQKKKGPTGKAFIYYPAKDSRQTLRPILKKFVRRIFGGSSLALINSLFESHPPTPEELNQLETLIAQLRRQTGAGRKQK
jgi:predicted transcriptional regulator